MISLKRNTKLDLIDATGRRSRSTSIYQPNQTEDFKISRGKFSNFLTCPRCFYIDRVSGLEEPGTPGWTLNEATDLLLKKEFDICREQQIPHRILIQNNMSHIVPFKHDSMDDWRNSRNKGLMWRYHDTNIILTGGIDDIWFNIETKQLIVVDYKSQANEKEVDQSSYLESPYHEGYKVQMDFYNYLLVKMGFEVSDTSYFLVVNANKNADGFFGKIDFSETLISYKHNISWIDEQVQNMINCMNKENLPDSHPSCQNCAYARERAKIE